MTRHLDLTIATSAAGEGGLALAVLIGSRSILLAPNLSKAIEGFDTIRHVDLWRIFERWEKEQTCERFVRNSPAS